MNNKYEELRAKAFSALQQLAKQNPDFAEVRMLVGAADADAALRQRTVRKSIDTEWISRVEAALPALDVVIRSPMVTIEDQEEVVPVELTRVISEKSIKHLAQHTNLIREIKDDEITPSHILNVYREESFLTYENKFINTLLSRLSAFVDKRFRALVGGCGVEQDYQFEYGVDFEHFSEDNRRTNAKVKLEIALTTPVSSPDNEIDADLNAQFASAIERVERIANALNAYLSSSFAQKLGRNYIRPPVIRTNAILKNKNIKDCLTLWEYIEGYDKTGFSVHWEEYSQVPPDQYVSDLYGLLALEYTQFYHGVIDRDVKLLAKREMPEVAPDFKSEAKEDELDDYMVYDSEYKKTVPVSRLMNNRKKLSEDERRMRDAIEIALRADDILFAEILKAEEEERRLERERIAREEAERARRAAMEEAAKRGPIVVRYRHSFLSRYIQGGEELQRFYTAIKNELLSYERVNSRISWKCESFRQGNNTLARMNVKGKTLYLYLALDPSDYDGKSYIIDVKKTNPDTPLLIKVKSDLALKRALTLIGDLAVKSSLVRFEREAEDFSMPYESTEELVERGLIKMILPPGITEINEFDVLIRAEMPKFEKSKVQVDSEVISDDTDDAWTETDSDDSIEEVTEDTVEEEKNDDLSDSDIDIAVQDDICLEYSKYGAIDATSIDFYHAEFVHNVTESMIDRLGISLQTVLVEEHKYVDHTYRKLAMAPIPRSVSKATRMYERNFIYAGEKRSVGISIPYTRDEYRAMTARDKKQVMQCATRIKDYELIRVRLAALRILKSSDTKMIEKMKMLEAKIALRESYLPKSEIWKEFIKEQE